MPLTELNIRFPTHNQVIVKFDEDETELLDFKSPVSKKDLDHLRWYIETYAAQYTGEPDDKEARRIETKLITLGDALFNEVFTTPKAQALFQQFQQQLTDKLLTIQTDEPEILALPWELLRDPHSHFLCHAQPRISIRRHCVKDLPASFTIQAKPKLRLLFVVSRPNDVSFLDPRLDPQAVLDALAEQDISQIEVEFLRPATLDKLTKRLENKNLPPVDIIHFDGHGYYSEKEQLGYLLFESAKIRGNSISGKKHEISSTDLSGILVSHNISLVVLSACQSATIGNEPLGSVAAGLTNKGVPTVLAMVYSVLVATTRQLFAAFYQALATGQGIAAALDHARLALASHNKRGTRRRGEGEFELTLQDWFVPALYQTNNDDALLLKDLRGFENLAALSISNLPQLQATGFFGRSRELWQIERWFVQGVERITITGFGGQGKTYCAIEAAHWLLRTDLFDSVCFVDFSRYQGLDALRYALNALGVLLDTTLLDENAVPPILQTRRLLWVWDNLESLADETLDELLTVAVQWSAHSHFLFTTHQHRFTQADYAESNPKHQYLDLMGLAELDALAYFNQLWQTAPPPEQLYPARYELIALFNKVAFHPLSIGLLAQQLKTRTIAELGERLEVLLLCEPENSEDKSLLASLKLSLESLPPEQRELVKRLGVFQGGALENGILEITEIKATEWGTLFSILESAGVIQIEDLTDVNFKFPYIRFHPTLASVLWKEINDSQQAKLSARYRQCYYQLLDYLYFEDSKNPHMIRAIALRELPNSLYAVYEALQEGEEFAVKFSCIVIYFLTNFGLQRDRLALTIATQAASTNIGSQDWIIGRSNHAHQLSHVGQYAQAITIFQEVLQHLEQIPNYELCQTLGELGRCFVEQGEIFVAIDYYEQALQIAEQLDQSTSVLKQTSYFHAGLADAFRYSGNFPQAKIHYEKALAIADKIGDIRQQAGVQTQLGTLEMLQSDLATAKQLYKTALDKFNGLKEPQSVAIVLHLLGVTHQKAEEWSDAEKAYRESARIKEAIGDLAGAAKTWINLALASETQGKLGAAEDWYRKIIEVQRSGNPKELAVSLNNLANLLQKQFCRLDEARQLAEQALAIRKNLDEGSSEIWMTYGVLAQIADKQHDAQAAQYRQQSRNSYLRFKGMPSQMRKYGSLIVSIINAILQPEQQLKLREAFLIQDPEESQNIRAIQKILNGERDEEDLLKPLDYEIAAIIHLILKGIANPESLATLFNS